jgi:hypothetical protein
MRRPVIPVVVILTATLALAGCSASAGGASSAADGGAVPVPAQPIVPDDGSGVAAGGTASIGTVAKPEADRSVVVTGELVVSTRDPLDAAKRATEIVEGAGGRIDGRNERAGADGGAGGATLVLRIPAAGLDTTLDALKRLGHPERLTTDVADVTTQRQDLDARIAALQATIQRMLQLEQRATDTTDLISIETAIGDRQAELESLQGQQRGLADQIAMSTITLSLQETGTTVAPATGSFLDGLRTGWSAFVAFWGQALIVLGVMLPWLALSIVLAAVAIGVVLLARRRGAARGSAA